MWTNKLFFLIDNKAIGVVKPGHIFTIEPMICEGVHQELMWYISIIISPLYIAEMYSFFFLGLTDGRQQQKTENAQHSLNTRFWLLRLA